jgi:hypothetical protein
MIRGLFACALVLAGCAVTPDLPDPVTECPVATDVRLVPRNVYVELPPAVTRDVVDPKPGEPETYGEAVEAAARRGVLLAQCRAQLREARDLQGRLVE